MRHLRAVVPEPPRSIEPQPDRAHPLDLLGGQLRHGVQSIPPGDQTGPGRPLQTVRFAWIWLACLSVVACRFDENADDPSAIEPDAGAATIDASPPPPPPDTSADASMPSDASSPDAPSPSDAPSPPDAPSPSDAPSPPDAPSPDGSAPIDAPLPDASTPDACTPDASTPDASMPDAGLLPLIVTHEHDFGLVQVGMTATGYVAFDNNTCGDVVVTSVTIGDASFTVLGT